jgi:lambda repressor-like predicted transcriptional regulator
VFVTVQNEQILRKLWAEGVTLKEIGAEFGLSAASICRHAQRLGLDGRSRNVRAADRDEFRALYVAGLTIADVASRTGFHRDTVRRALVASGVTLQNRSRRWPVRHEAFAEPRSAEASYWLGMLAADGCVQGPKISLVQHASRVAMLRRFLTFVGSPDRPLRVRTPATDSSRMSRPRAWLPTLRATASSLGSRSRWKQAKRPPRKPSFGSAFSTGTVVAHSPRAESRRSGSWEAAP